MNRPYPLYTLPEIASLKQMIESWAQDEPDRVAFRWRESRDIREKSVRGFLQNVNAQGSWMFHIGIRRCHIALISLNSYAWLVVWFAAVCGDCVIVPIDRELPPEEIGKLIRRSDCSVVFADEKTLKKLDGHLEDLSCFPMESLQDMLEQGRHLIRLGNCDYTRLPQDTERLATIVYTSGTTGESKGVMLSQKNIVANINQCCRFFDPMGASLSVLPYHHLFGLVPSLIMFFNYRSTVFISTGRKYLMRDFETAKPRTTMLVPLHIMTFHKRIMQEAKKSGKYNKLRAGMRLSLLLYGLGIDVRKRLMKDVRRTFGGELEYILVGGASLDPFYEREFRALGIDLITAYGATECSPGIAVNRNHYHRDGSAGLPIPGCEVRIAKDGEVLIRGANVMTGYYKDPQATKEALRDGWYHSGDLGHLDQDGFLFLTGRKKNLIILSNGENVSPEGLERRIEAVPGTQEVLVYAEDDAITAEIFPDQAHTGLQDYFDEQIRRLNEVLPTSQRIRTVRLRETEFPKNAMRKILRHTAGKDSVHVR